MIGLILHSQGPPASESVLRGHGEHREEPRRPILAFSANRTGAAFIESVAALCLVSRTPSTPPGSAADPGRMPVIFSYSIGQGLISRPHAVQSNSALLWMLLRDRIFLPRAVITAIRHDRLIGKEL